MTALISLDEVIKHLRVTYDDEYDLIALYTEAAISHVADYCNIPVSELSERVDPKILRAAVLLLVGDLFENREAQSGQELFENKTVSRLLDTQRNMQA